MSFNTGFIADNENYSNTDLSNIFPPFEIIYYNLTGDSSSVTKTLNLTKNNSSTTNYAVFPSIYYGYSGSGGTYNAVNTSSAINNIIISSITSTNFTFNLSKSTGDNVNVYLVFLVIYSSGASYPKSY